MTVCHRNQPQAGRHNAHESSRKGKKPHASKQQQRPQHQQRQKYHPQQQQTSHNQTKEHLRSRQFIRELLYGGSGSDHFSSTLSAFTTLTKLAREENLNQLAEEICTISMEPSRLTGSLLSFLNGLSSVSGVERGAAKHLLTSVLRALACVPELFDRLLQSLEKYGWCERDLRTVSWFLYYATAAREDTALDDVVDVSSLTEWIGRMYTRIGQPANNYLSKLRVRQLGEHTTSDVEERHNNDHPDFRQVAIVPTAEELRVGGELNDLDRIPSVLDAQLQQMSDCHNNDCHKVDEDTMASMQSGLLERHFRLVRLDMLMSIKEELSDSNPRRIVFNGVRVLGVKQPRKGCLSIIVQFSIPQYHCIHRIKSKEGRVAYIDKHSRTLSTGSMVCLIRNNQPVTCCEINWRDSASIGSDPTKATIGFKVDGHVLDVLLGSSAAAQGIRMVQICSSFISYEPVLSALQHMDEIPFAEELCLSKPQDFAPSTTKHSRLYLSPSEQGFTEGRLVDRAFDYHLKVHQALDSSQRRAVEMCFNQRVSLIQGPPGTGKSFVGSTVADIILQSDANAAILCVAYTNHALDQFLAELLNRGYTDIVRVGGTCKDQRLEPYRLSTFGPKVTLPRNEYRRKKQLIEEKDERAREICQLTHKLSLSLGKKGWHVIRNHLSHEERVQLEPQEGFETQQAGHVWTAWLRGDKSAASACGGRGRLWQLSKDERVRLMREWEESRVKGPLRTKLDKLMAEERQDTSELEGLRLSALSSQLSSARVVGCTTTGAAKYRELLQHFEASTIMVEEAGEVLEAHILTCLKPCERMILIGDHKQLRPKVQSYPLTVESGQGIDLNKSLFERMVEGGYPHAQLNTQHRMRPEISQFVRRMTYPTLKDHLSTSNLPRNVVGLASNIMFVDHREKEGGESNEKSISKQNAFECEMVVETALYLLKQGYKSSQLVILTPYLGQLVSIRDCLSSKRESICLGEADVEELRNNGVVSSDGESVNSDNGSREEGIRVSTIDNFQGEEADIVVASLVRSNDDGKVGFLGERERVNVLLSRARFGLVMFGNMEMLTERATNRRAKQLWREVKELFTESRIVPGLMTICGRHGTMKELSEPCDFVKWTKDGGCQLTCAKSLECNHQCGLSCHNQSAVKCRCTATITTSCESGHVLSHRCGAPVPRCKVCAEIAKKTRAHLAKLDAIREEQLRAKNELEQERVAHEQQLVEIRERKRAEQLRCSLQIAKAKGSGRAMKAELDAAIEKQRADAMAQLNVMEEELTNKLRSLEEKKRVDKARLDDELRKASDDMQQRLARIKQREQRELDRAVAEHNEAMEALRVKRDEEVAKLRAEKSRLQKLSLQSHSNRKLLVEGGDKGSLARATATCSTCYDDDVLEVNGIFCPAASEERHFFCQDCFNGFVKSACGGAEGGKEEHLSCPHKCTEHRFEDRDIAMVVAPDTFTKYMSSRERIVERRLTRDLNQRMEEEQKRLKAQTAFERESKEATEHIVDNILTLKCPRCAQAFLDFDGCLALYCANKDCGCGFCALCQKDCGHDAHQHVLQCPEIQRNGRGNYFGSREQVTEAWKAMKKRKLERYWLNLQPKVRGSIRANIMVHANDLGRLDLPLQ